MLQKGRSDTTSSQLSTNKGLKSPVQFVKGVGPRLGAIFASRGIQDVADLLTFFPRAYEDRSKFSQVSELAADQVATLSLEVVSSRKIPIRMGRSILEVRCQDASGKIALKWFHAPRGMDQRFRPGTQFVVTGKVKIFQGKPEIVHPEINWGVSTDTEDSSNFGRVVPIYVEIEGIPTRTLRKVLWEALEKYSPFIVDDLPAGLLAKHQLPPIREAIREIHFPGEGVDLDKLTSFALPSHSRLAYDEFFKFEYLILRKKKRLEKERAIRLDPARASAAVASLEKALPFKLTGDQSKAVAEALGDAAKGTPMHRLIQGDVGSGKTAVAFLIAAAFLAEGSQAALMAPTEILAEQHFKKAKELLGDKIAVALLSGRTPQTERNALFKRLKAGEPLLLIGTHALIEDPVVFKQLDLVMIDEQHRFGVEQRRALKKKGMRDSLLPHSLVLTATPIPRTLALTAYGDLAVSSIQEMPPGRTPVVTKVLRGNTRQSAYEEIRAQLKQGRQAYFIYPLINESEAEGFTSLKAATIEAEVLQKEVFPEFRVGLLHGQMKPDEKSAVMARFKAHELDILVSTTVIEVGVDVPNSTVMAVEHSERFGLSQLHQLRGRVGRGSNQSYCFFFGSQNPAEKTQARLEVLEETSDGFKIAEADLQIRGPGEFLGTRQAGALPFRLADLVRDREWLFKAREDAQTVLQTDPELTKPEHFALRKYFENEGFLQSERFTS